MLNNSLFICYSTPNYEKLTTIFLESLKNIVDESKINHLLDDYNNFTQTGFQSDIWYYSVRNKIRHLIHVLSTCNTCNTCENTPLYFTFTDCDIVYTNNRDEWNNLEKYIINEPQDIFFMREHTSNDVNSGFFVIKNNENIRNILHFFIEVLYIFDNNDKVNMPFGDQSVINFLKDKINYGFIPNEYVVFATTIYDKNKSLFHHATGAKDVDDKIEQINYIKQQFI